MKSKPYQYLMRKAYVTICLMMINGSFFAQMKFGYAEDGSMSGRKYFDRNDNELNL